MSSTGPGCRTKTPRRGNCSTSLNWASLGNASRTGALETENRSDNWTWSRRSPSAPDGFQRIAQFRSRNSAIGKDVAQHGIPRGDAPQHIRRAVTILNPGAVDLDPDEQSARIGDDMALAPLDPLAGIIPAIGKAGSRRYPDFTIEDPDTDVTWLWEHLGMLGNAEYDEKWGYKQEWYRKNGVKPAEECGGEVATLVTTTEKNGIDHDQIANLIRMVKEGS